MDISAEYGNFFDINAIKDIKNRDERTALKEVAKQLESVFLQMVLKSMSDSNAVMQSEMFDRGSEKFYQEMLDQQLALSLSKSGGIGLADIIVRQLEKHHAETTTQPLTVPMKIDKQPIVSTKDKPTPNFIESILPHAQNAAKALGIDPHLLIAQTVLETGWGKHILANNLFGMKAQDGQGVLAATTEYVQDVKVKVQDTFKSYQSYADSFYDYVKLLGSKRYESALSAQTPRDYLQGLKDAGYATDPNYVDKVMAIYEKLSKKSIS